MYSALFCYENCFFFMNGKLVQTCRAAMKIFCTFARAMCNMPKVDVFQNVTIALVCSRVGLVITNLFHVICSRCISCKYLHNFRGSMKKLAKRCLPSPHLHHTHSSSQICLCTMVLLAVRQVKHPQRCKFTFYIQHNIDSIFAEPRIKWFSIL